MKKIKLAHIIKTIKNKGKEDSISFQDMYLFRHAMKLVGEYLAEDSTYSGVIIKDQSDKTIVMINSTNTHSDTESGKIFEFMIIPTGDVADTSKFYDHKCEGIMRGFTGEEKDFILSCGDKTIVPAGVLLYDVYNSERMERIATPAKAKLEILYTNRNLRGRGVATRLKHHFNEALKCRGVDSFFGYSSALDLIDGKDKKNSNEVLKRIYGRMGIHIVPDDPHGLFFGYPKEFEDIDLPIKYLNPTKTTAKSKSKSGSIDTAKPVAVLEELEK